MAGKGFIGWFRSGIRFTGRLFKNIFKQLRWAWRVNDQSHKWFYSIPTWGNRIWALAIYDFIIILAIYLILVPILLVWAFIESI